jgi:hypothetical protein
MAGIKSMIVGKKYSLHDSYGVDEIECLAVKITAEYYAVKIRYLKDGYEDFYIESEKDPSYVEEIE